MAIVIPEQAVLRWQFPKKGTVKRSHLVTGLMVVHHVGSEVISLHFVCVSVEKARACRKWIPKLPVSKGKRERLPSLILRPAPDGVVTCDSFVTNGEGTISLIKHS